jgi:hypothetical protein
MVFHFGCSTFHFAVTTHEFILDLCAFGYYRIDSCLSIFSNTRVRSGTSPRQSRVGVGFIFLICIWNGRNWIRIIGKSCRSHKHSFCIPGMRIPSADWITHCVFTESAYAQANLISNFQFVYSESTSYSKSIETRRPPVKP